MAVIKAAGYGCECVPDSTGRELGAASAGGLRCAAYEERLGANAGQGVPWHWHDELEVVLVESGEVRARSEGGSAQLKVGDVIFFNARTFHMLAGSPNARIRSLVFDSALVSGGAGSDIARRYVEPVLERADLKCYVWPSRDEGARRAAGDLDASGEDSCLTSLARWVLDAYDAMEREPFGFECDVRGALSRCMIELARVVGTDGEGASGIGVRSTRLQLMSDYIEANYMKPLRVGDIASAVGVSERECLRCFRDVIDETPSHFLQMRRLAHAAHELASASEPLISEVARSVGIADASAFSRMFKAVYGKSPREYRKAFRAASGRAAKHSTSC